MSATHSFLFTKFTNVWSTWHKGCKKKQNKRKKNLFLTLYLKVSPSWHVMNINSHSFFDVHEQGSHSFFSNKCKYFSLSFPVISRTPHVMFSARNRRKNRIEVMIQNSLVIQPKRQNAGGPTAAGGPLEFLLAGSPVAPSRHAAIRPYMFLAKEQQPPGDHCRTDKQKANIHSNCTLMCAFKQA